MGTWWNSIDAVSKFSTNMQILAWVLGIITTIVAVIAGVSAKHLNTLKNIDKRLENTESHLGQRSLTTLQEQELQLLLKQNDLKVRIPIICPAGSSEACNFGHQLSNVIIKAGWDTEPETGTALPAWHGLILTVEDNNHPPLSATLLATQLQKYGFPVLITDRNGAPRITSISGSKSLNGPPVKQDLLNLWVGDNPPLKR